MRTKPYATVVGALFLASILSLSGCALFWLGLGGAGGYMIRKGEEGGSTKAGRSSSSGAEGESSSREYY